MVQHANTIAATASPECRERMVHRATEWSAVSMSWPLEPEYIWTSTGVPTNRTSALDRITCDGEVSSTGIRAFGIDNGARAIKLYDWYPILSHENKYHSKSFILYSFYLVPQKFVLKTYHILKNTFSLNYYLFNCFQTKYFSNVYCKTWFNWLRLNFRIFLSNLCT